jgi:hypothetical protein
MMRICRVVVVCVAKSSISSFRVQRRRFAIHAVACYQRIKGVVEGKAVVRLKGYSTCHILLVVSVFAPKGVRSFRMLLDDVSLLSVVFNVTILSHGVMLLQLLLEQRCCSGSMLERRRWQLVFFTP